MVVFCYGALCRTYFILHVLWGTFHQASLAQVLPCNYRNHKHHTSIRSTCLLDHGRTKLQSSPCLPLVVLLVLACTAGAGGEGEASCRAKAKTRAANAEGQILAGQGRDRGAGRYLPIHARLGAVSPPCFDGGRKTSEEMQSMRFRFRQGGRTNMKAQPLGASFSTSRTSPPQAPNRWLVDLACDPA